MSKNKSGLKSGQRVTLAGAGGVISALIDGVRTDNPTLGVHLSISDDWGTDKAGDFTVLDIGDNVICSGLACKVLSQPFLSTMANDPLEIPLWCVVVKPYDKDLVVVARLTAVRKETQKEARVRRDLTELTTMIADSKNNYGLPDNAQIVVGDIGYTFTVGHKTMIEKLNNKTFYNQVKGFLWGWKENQTYDEIPF